MEPQHGARYEEIVALAQATERAGFDAFFRSDHLFGVNPDDATYRPTDCWTTLAGVARETERVRLGSLVTAATFRNPGLLATIVASVDEMSGGRIELGLGTGWYEREHAAFGIGFPSVGERFDRFEEQLEIITGLWRTEPGAGEGYSFSGKHYQVAGNRTPPRVVQSPHPPVIVGGTGPRRTPAIAARFADEFNTGYWGDVAGRFEVFARACEAIGRDPDGARRSVLMQVACGRMPDEIDRRAAAIGSDQMRKHAVIGGPDEVASRIREAIDVGADTIYLHIFDIHDLDHIALIGEEVLPQLGTAGVPGQSVPSTPLERTGTR
jgi:F420-dependent oxidoreductase-like protein